MHHPLNASYVHHSFAFGFYRAFVRLGAKVQEYGGRSCLVSSAQMQITFLQRAHATETNRSTRAAAAPATQRQMQAEKETTEENMAHTGGSSRTQTPIFAGVAAADVQGELDWFSAKGAAILNTLEDYGPKAAFPLVSVPSLWASFCLI